VIDLEYFVKAESFNFLQNDLGILKKRKEKLRK